MFVILLSSVWSCRFCNVTKHIFIWLPHLIIAPSLCFLPANGGFIVILLFIIVTRWEIFSSSAPLCAPLSLNNLCVTLPPHPLFSLSVAASVSTPFASSWRSPVSSPWSLRCVSAGIPPPTQDAVDGSSSFHPVSVSLPPSRPLIFLVSHCVNSGLTGSCRAVWRLRGWRSRRERL